MTIPLFRSAAFAAIVILSLSCQPRSPENRVVAQVNGDRITLAELREEIALYRDQHQGEPETESAADDHLKSIIERRLMLQEAAKEAIPPPAGASGRSRERMLISQLVRTKTGEWESRIVATEEDIRRHYDRLRFDVMVTVAHAKDLATAENIAEQMRLGKPVPDSEILGPLFYESVRLTALENAFDLDRGDIGVFAADDGFMVIQVMKKEPLKLPSYKSMREKLRNDALEIMREKTMADWMESVKSKAKIVVNQALVKEAAAGVK
ncbi:MAG: hypothetical protein M0042_03925 [Nitrospiraceae bacterium]|nr:hypothetical protein [Nitrospiraceae bacterium]